jgi:cysteine-rich repeat protein
MRAFCGDGRLYEAVELCDDGNRSNDDGCLNDCAPARCGDGFVHEGVEQCDDGNADDSDECPASCRPAVCGDRYARAGIEECDDGNRRDDDGCVSGCHAARCGDGFVRFGVEQCDPAHPTQQEFCNADCGIVAACGDTDGDGLVLARTMCDLDANGRVTATDARLALLSAVGLTERARCSGSRYVVFVLSDERTHGALQVDIDYAAAGGSFSMSPGGTACSTLVRDTIASYNDDPDAHRLQMGFISLGGFAGPRDLARCRYYSDDDAIPAAFAISVADAAHPDLTPIVPPPAVTYRFE